MKLLQRVTTALLAAACTVPVSADWTQVSDVRVPEREDYFGYGLALSANFLVVSAPYADNEQNEEAAGVIHIYRRGKEDSLDLDHELYGAQESEGFGFSIDMAYDTDIIVAGGPMEGMVVDSNVVSTEGVVRVYAYNDLVEDGWSQLGQDLRGREQHEKFGQSVSISDDGNIICIGVGKDEVDAEQRVDVYALQRGKEMNSWKFVGEVRVPDSETGDDLDEVIVDIVQNGDKPEYFVALSSGRYNGGKGMAMVFMVTSEHVEGAENEKPNFLLLGRKMVGDYDHDEFGASISLGMNDGTIYLAVGVPCSGYYGPRGGNDVEGDSFDEGNSLSDGRVEVYTFEISSAEDTSARWKFAYKIDQMQNEDGTGEAVVFSRDALRLVVGSPKMQDFTGSVRVFDYHKGSFRPVGEQFFDGEQKYQGFGTHLAMHDLELVAGAPYADYAKVYRFEGTSPYGQIIKGKKRRSGFVTFILVVFIISVLSSVGYCAYVRAKGGRNCFHLTGRRSVYNPTPTANASTVATINQNYEQNHLFSHGGLALPQEDSVTGDGVELMGARRSSDIESREIS